ncbi:MAG: macro domain-containing protein [Oscillospiraceae bacterium]
MLGPCGAAILCCGAAWPGSSSPAWGSFTLRTWPGTWCLPPIRRAAPFWAARWWRPLGSLRNFRIQAQIGGVDEKTAFRLAVGELIARLTAWRPLPPVRRVLALHASQCSTSNTLALWELVKAALPPEIAVEEVGLRNGTVPDCNGCSYTACLHFGEQGSCFYGGPMVEEVYPAVRRCDALVMLCANYNDALSANLTACVNRLTALFRQTRFYDKRLFGLVVSGYSGGDLLARQLISALNMNKSFFLPPHFCLLETANERGAFCTCPASGTLPPPLPGRWQSNGLRLRRGLCGPGTALRLDFESLKAGDTMPLIIVRNDITKMPVDAIVNAAKESLLGGGGVDGCIHRAAGPELLQECRTAGRLPDRRGQDHESAYRLPCRYIIHTVGPVWNGGKCGEREQLASCYRTSLALAKEHGCETVAFPLISSGVFGYPKDQALRVAVDTISEFLAENDMTVYLVIFSRAAYQIGNKLFADIAAYIDDHYVDAHTDSRRERMRRMGVVESRMLTAYEDAPMATSGLDEALAHLDAGFSETLLKLIDRSGKKDAEVYKKANVDRKLFSKIRNNPDYKPSKPTAVAFAIALELSLPETRDLIARAGYALSPSSKFDVIIEYFIMQRDYDIFKINEALFAF